MTNNEPYKHTATKQFGTAAILKLMAVLALFMAFGVMANDIRCLFFMIASVSLFSAEHFATSRKAEFFLLIGFPTIGWLIAAICFSVSLLYTGTLPSIWDGVGQFVALLLLAMVMSVFASALSVVAVCLMCGWFFRITGIRLLKFNWSDDPAAADADGNSLVTEKHGS